MYKALIVDDEMAARETISLLINWPEIGFEEPDMAADGRKALDLFEQRQYDIIFTDIEMPVMDGLKMMERMKQKRPEQRFVIISCHESFAYAKKAMAMGVSDYLIKDLMSAEEIYACLLEHTAKEKDIPMNRTDTAYRDCGEILLKLISEEPLERAEKEIFCTRLGRRQGSNSYSVGLVSMDEKEQRQWGLSYRMLCKLKKLYKKVCRGGVAAILPNNRDIMILIEQKGQVSTAEKMNQMLEYMNHIRGLGRECGIFSLTIGVSEESNDIGDAGKLYAQAQRACNMKVFRGSNRTIFYNVISDSTKGLRGEPLEAYLEQMERFIVNKDNRYKEILRKLYRPSLCGGFLENNYLSYVNWRLWGILFYIRRQVHGKEMPGGDVIRQDVEQINQLDSAKDMERFFTELIRKYFIADQDAEETGIAGKAKSYVEDKLNEDISLAQIADTLHIHKNYLCRVFKEETGINLVSYIRERKIREARKMLEEKEFKIYEIAELLGYQSPQYFTLVFKKETGISPNDYRRRFFGSRS